MGPSRGMGPSRWGTGKGPIGGGVTEEPGADGTVPAAGTWEIDRSSTVGFVARQFLVNRVRGRFASFRATVEVADDLGATITGEVQAASVDTGDPARDQHLRSADFFDVARWPTMTLVAEMAGADLDRSSFVLDSRLTIRDVTRTVPFTVRLLQVTDGPGAAPTLTAAALASVSRKDFGLQWSPALETGGVVVADQVDLVLDLRARRVGS